MNRTGKAVVVLFVGLVANLLIACEKIDFTFTVDSTLDAPDVTPGDNVCRTAANTCTLRAAIGEANALTGKVQVNLAAGATYTLTRAGTDDANSVGDLDVTGDVRLVGNATVIDAAGLDRVVDVAGYLRLTAITLRNGVSTADGGGARVRSGTLDLHKTVITANTALGDGGGVAVVGGGMSVKTSTIHANTAGRSGGGVDVAPGAWSTMTNATVSGNRVDPRMTGALTSTADGGDAAPHTGPAGVLELEAPTVSAGAALDAPAAADGTVPVIVRLDGQGTSGIAQSRERVLGRSGARGQSVRVNRSYDHLPFVAVNATPAEVERLRADPNVISVQPDTLDAPGLAQSVTRIGADKTAALGVDGSGWSVAVIDSGVDADEPMTNGRVVAGACFARGADGALNGAGSCPAGGDTQLGAGAGENCAWDGCYHGTHVASTAVGAPRSGSGTVLQGVAPGAGIVSVNVFSLFTDSTTCGVGVPHCIRSWVSDQLAALNWIHGQSAALKVAAVNMSLGGGSFASACDADARKVPIDLMAANGIPTVVASGNSGDKGGVGSPGCISTAVTVGATSDVSDVAAGFSQSGTMLDLLAPGVDITAEYPTIPGDPNDYVATLSGTSMAAPHVAGAMVVLRAGAPNASAAALAAALTSTGTSVTDTNGITRPRIDVRAALDAVATVGVGGGIANRGTLTLTGTTVTSNVAWAGSGIHTRGAVTVGGSIVASSASGAVCVAASGGGVSSSGRNVGSDTSCFNGGTDLGGASVLLGALADNGGPTPTHLPAAGSPVRNRIPAGTAVLCTGGTLTDQRLVARPQGGACDSGSVET